MRVDATCVTIKSRSTLFQFKRKRRTSAAPSDSEEKAVSVIEDSGLFSEAFYVSHNPGARRSKLSPVRHYIRYGYKRNLEVHPEFSLLGYFAKYPSVRSFVNTKRRSALEHYVKIGKKAGLSLPSPSESPIWQCSRGHIELPDADILVQRMAGISYFYRFAFKRKEWSDDEPFLEAAIRDLCSRPAGLHSADRPDVSIIVPVYGQTQFLLNCLDSLASQTSRYSAEILIVDDASPGKWKTECLDEIPWIRLVRLDHNKGFVGACNFGASLARGRYFVLLNSDVRVARSWLDELVDSFALFPNAGLVGSKLFFGNGSLQEAGGYYHADGSGGNRGYRQKPGHPKFSYAREVDYCSGASIAVTSELWKGVGGFEEAYAPAYYEDGDLAFKVREIGREVWFQPMSRVLHYDGFSHHSQVKAGQMAANREIFVSRWGPRLAGHKDRGQGYQPPRAGSRGRVLIIDSNTPRPKNDSGSFMTERIMFALQALGFDIAFAPVHLRHDPEHTQALQRRGVQCLYTPFVSSFADVWEKCGAFDYIFVFRVENAMTVIPEVRRKDLSSRIIYHTVDLHYVRMQRESEVLNQRNLLFAAERTKTRELACVHSSDCAIVHTEAERQAICNEIGGRNILTFTYIADLVPATAGFDDRKSILFLGGYKHPPNVDAVLYLARDIWPLVVEEMSDPGMRLLVVGAEPPSTIRALDGASISIEGWVEDLRPSFEGARIFVAPLRYGSGVKGKIVQALAHGTPVVATSIAAEGFDFVHGRDALIADNPGDFASCIARLYRDKDLWLKLQEAGYKIVAERFSSKRGMELCEEALTIADRTWLRREEMRRRQFIESGVDNANLKEIAPGQ
ncbi:MAG: glycosyltransferase [bacterium]|nr:glycosyltransferase [bacterium]